MSNQPRRRGPMGGGHGRMGTGEKAKDFKGTMKKLFTYLSEYKIGIFFVMIFAIGSTVFNIIGPKVLGKATTEIFKGLVGKVSGGSGIDFTKIGKILLTLLCLYVISACFSFIQGYIMTGVSQKLTYRMRKEISEKINRMPMNYFDTTTHGEVLSRVTNDVDTLSQSLNQSATAGDHIGDNDHRCADHDAQYQSVDDCDRTSDPAGIYGTDFCNRKTLTEILQKPAGVSGPCKRTGRRNLWRS